MRIDERDWKWYGKAGHFICGNDCRFHLCTEIGPWLVSTVGEYLPDSTVRESLADARGMKLEGRGDARRADWMKKAGYEDIGYDRKYETMVFRTEGQCDCGCGQPLIIPSEIDFDGYSDPGAATEGHVKLCATWASREKDWKPSEDTP